MFGTAAGVMEGQFLDDAGVRRLEKLPTKKELIAMVARLIKQARVPSPAAEHVQMPQAYLGLLQDVAPDQACACMFIAS